MKGRGEIVPTISSLSIYKFFFQQQKIIYHHNQLVAAADKASFKKFHFFGYFPLTAESGSIFVILYSGQTPLIEVTFKLVGRPLKDRGGGYILDIHPKP